MCDLLVIKRRITAGKRITLAFGKLNVCFSRRKFYLGRENLVRWHREFAYRRHVICHYKTRVNKNEKCDKRKYPTRI